jgi:hypothetical protein
MGNKGSKGKGKKGAPTPAKAPAATTKRVEEPVNSEPVIIDKNTLDAINSSEAVQEARNAAAETKEKAKRASEHADSVVAKTNEVIAATKVAEEKAEEPAAAAAEPAKEAAVVSQANHQKETPLSVPIGHTTFSWNSKGEKCPLGHTNFSYGKTNWVSGVF